MLLLKYNLENENRRYCSNYFDFIIRKRIFETITKSIFWVILPLYRITDKL